MKRTYLTNNTPINFNFKQTPKSFIVKEQLKYKLLKRGFYKLYRIKKVEKSTIELIEYLSEVLKIDKKEFGYAGLKDKHATTYQYITLPKEIALSSRFQNSSEVEIEELGFVKERLKIGALLGNEFIITLNNIDENNFYLLQNALKRLSQYGFANFFGQQRFGRLDEVEKSAKLIILKGKKAKTQEARIILAAYQAKFFNEWLNKRLMLSRELSKNKSSLKLSKKLIETIASSPTLFKLLPGDLGFSYKNGRKEFAVVNDIATFSQSFAAKRFYPTGVLYGSDVRLANSIAGDIEREFIDRDFHALRGARRAAWVWPKNLEASYDKQKQNATLNFALPAGSYATTLLEELKNGELS